MRWLALLVLGFATGAGAATPASQAEFHAQVVSLYSFEPHTLSNPEMQAKSGQLDQFWSMVKANPAGTLPMLRSELEDPSNSAFFFYDGSKLLLSLSKEGSDKALALRAIPKADLRGIQPTDYLRTVHWLGAEGLDTREATFRILAHPDFKAFIVQHALTLAQDYSLICMLFAMEETSFVEDLARHLARETNPTSQKSLLLALWYTATPAGNAAIRDFASKGTTTEGVAYAKKLLERKGGLGLTMSSEKALRNERRELMRRPISDEALMEFDSLTSKILAKQR